ncbi:MAG TPA: hypothetical protein PLE51_02545 [Candidatus Pacearchaeota archaeon]|nr:hypothetical protein [Candidatus Pacearchaeota archaeon]HOR52520.1 hypothetical protein [Candidatus Pacearchaeota archaeon]HPJ86911.1 hypothetical protein [Candidatus Pacearchaeota archaeon]HQF83226.1 hypothetical protein [Candidatus Pacearchaeota archaeon]HQI57721.1 hypothetical protein [Candidatus Pacearchaeota archaeon]
MKRKTKIIILVIVSLVIIAILVNELILKEGVERDPAKERVLPLTEQQSANEIGKAFGSDEDKSAIYPKSRSLIIKQGQEEAIALGIKNLLENSSDVSIFSYNIIVAESTCGDENVLDWISNGKSEENIPISFGDIYATKIHILIPKKAPPCTVRYHIEIKNEIDGIYQEYDNILFTVTSKAR